ncbi:hypothetical protein HMPREF0239_02271 [Clostridium sp. ATCC BAA-442]|nr:hypothetical protein HMPREF0239_02271 [Clostridium sp. ATCC BAA-442]
MFSAFSPPMFYFSIQAYHPTFDKRQQSRFQASIIPLPFHT